MQTSFPKQVPIIKAIREKAPIPKWATIRGRPLNLVALVGRAAAPNLESIQGRASVLNPETVQKVQAETVPKHPLTLMGTTPIVRLATATTLNQVTMARMRTVLCTQVPARS